MQAKKRFCVVTLIGIMTLYCVCTRKSTNSSENDNSLLESLPSFATMEMLLEKPVSQPKQPKLVEHPCRMETCFDFTRCGDNPKIYVYPTEGGVSISYRKLLATVRESKYITHNPNEACLFLPAIDTLDADPLSPEHVSDVGEKLARLPHWNNGRNHIIFNLYAGTWPDYTEDALGFKPGDAILARASASETIFRHGFDISLPLFHKEHPEKGGAPAAATANAFPAIRQYLLAFKGKRYVHGIGSETRNSLWHLHDGKSIVLVTTCKHGKSWKDLRDERCDEDNMEYDKYDYEQLLSNSTFCLVARGRRLGSYRFLEALAAGCIPVLLSNGWRLPFDERIDWRKAVIWADERLLFQVPELIRSVSPERVLALRQQTQLLWEQYFSSIEKIAFTTIEILIDRVTAWRWSRARESLVWNGPAGALVSAALYGDSRGQRPAPCAPLPAPPSAVRPRPPRPLSAPSAAPAAAPSSPGDSFTALVYVRSTEPTLHKLLSNLAKTKYCEKVVLVWVSDRGPPSVRSVPRWPPDPRGPLAVALIDGGTHFPGEGVSVRWRAVTSVKTAGVLSLDGDALLLPEEMDYAFHVWRHFTDRIVGYPARTHYWDEAKGSWGYSSRWGSSYSAVLSGAAMVHRAYLESALSAPPAALNAVQRTQNCDDLLLACVVAHATRLPPIKLAQRSRGHYTSRSMWSDPEHFVQRQSCLNTFAMAYGYMPLVRSIVRLDPILYKDPVSKKRKKYIKMELVS